MTTVAAIAVDGAVYVAADSRTNVYERPIDNGARKIRRVTCTKGGELLLAFCGAGALADLVPAKLDVEALPAHDDDAQQWAAAIAWAVSDIAFDARLTDGGQMDGSILLAASGRLWTLSNYGAIPHPDGIAALGSGEGPAIGVIDVLLELGADDPAHVVRRAVAIACHRDRHSSPPIYFETIAAAAP